MLVTEGHNHVPLLGQFELSLFFQQQMFVIPRPHLASSPKRITDKARLSLDYSQKSSKWHLLESLAQKLQSERVLQLVKYF